MMGMGAQDGLPVRGGRADARPVVEDAIGNLDGLVEVVANLFLSLVRRSRIIKVVVIGRSHYILSPTFWEEVNFPGKDPIEVQVGGFYFEDFSFIGEERQAGEKGILGESVPFAEN